MLALNAMRVVTPMSAIPAATVPYERNALHAFLDRPAQDVFAQRVDDSSMVVVPLCAQADLPAPRKALVAADHLRLVSSLTREAVFRLLVGMGSIGYRVTRRRPPVVESSKLENLIPADLGLPSWLKKRVVLQFDTRIIHVMGADPCVVLTCCPRLRAIIGVPCSELAGLGVPLLGASVTSHVEDRHLGVAPRRAYAGVVTAVGDDGLLSLADAGDGPERVQAEALYLEATRANFDSVVHVLTQGRTERFQDRMRQVEGEWHAGGRTLDTVKGVLAWVGRQGTELADGVPLSFDGMMDEARPTPTLRFPKAVRIPKPRLSFDPSDSSSTGDIWAQQGLDRLGPYDSGTFARKRLRIAVVCEAAQRPAAEALVQDFLDGTPDVSSGGARPLVPHPNGMLGRFRLSRPEVGFFEAQGDTAACYVSAAREAVSAAAARDERWDLALVQVRRAWRERPDGDSPYWASKAAFLKQETVVQAISVEAMGLPAFQYACSLANMSLATYAKLGGFPWLLPMRAAADHELVIGLGSHTTKVGRRGAGDRVVGIATLFSGQGHYLLDSRTGAVPFAAYPQALRETVTDAIGRVRDEQGWRPGDAVRLTFHAFIEMRREAADAVMAAVSGLGLASVRFAFVHVAQEHPYLTFDQGTRTGKGAFAPERGMAVELGETEWLLALIGREQVKSDGQGLPHPVLLRLNRLSTWRDMPTIVRQISDFACHSWRTFGPARLPITLGYANEIAKQLAGLERTPNWDGDAVEGSRVMRRPWYL